MLTVEKLRAFGANVDEGLERCMGNESFYLRMVKLALSDANFDKLARAAENDDAKAGFEAAHALKGVLANLAITPVCTPVSELTELLRSSRSVDFRTAVRGILDLRAVLASLDD